MTERMYVLVVVAVAAAAAVVVVVVVSVAVAVPIVRCDSFPLTICSNFAQKQL